MTLFQGRNLEHAYLVKASDLLKCSLHNLVRRYSTWGFLDDDQHIELYPKVNPGLVYCQSSLISLIFKMTLSSSSHTYDLRINDWALETEHITNIRPIKPCCSWL